MLLHLAESPIVGRRRAVLVGWTPSDVPSFTAGSSVGTTHVTVQISDLARTGSPFEAEFLVDTDSLHCLAPASRLREAGIAPEGRQVYHLASGEPIEYEYGFARVSFLGDETVAHVIFGAEDAEPLLGVVALENTGLVVDPANRTLRRLPAMPLK